MTGDASAHGVPDVVFDPNSIEFFEDPFPIYARLRDEAPVYHNAELGFWALSRYQDVFDASMNWQVFTSTHGSTLSDLKNPEYEPGGMILNTDPPFHDRLRQLVNRAFAPKGVKLMDRVVRDVIGDVIATIEGRDSFDVVADFTAIFPNEIISTILGVPPEARPDVRRWTDDILYREEGAVDVVEKTIQAYMAQTNYFVELVAERRAQPADDMISMLTEAEIDDGDGGRTRLTDLEIAQFSFILGAAGTETVTKLVANAIVLFHRHRDQLQLVLDDPMLVPSVVEETLRYWAPSHLQGRYTTADVTLHDVTIPKDQPVFLITGSANRDPRAYDDPDLFDVTREPGATPLGFGRGIHYCIGAALARTESRIAIEEFLARWPGFEVDENNLQRVHMANVAGYSNVPITVGS